MSIKKIALGSAAVVMAFGSAAQASVIDRPFFKVLGTVVVWSATDNSGNAVVHDFILGTTGSPDLIAGDGNAVVTGTLVPLDQSTVGSAFDANGDGNLDNPLTVADSVDAQVGEYLSSYHVASNTPFNIEAVADQFVATGDFDESVGGETPAAYDALHADNISLALAVSQTGTSGSVNFGSAAQLPYSNASTAFGAFETGTTLDNILTSSDVFAGDQRTASTAGTIAEQSVRFDATYNLQDNSGNAYDMSMGFGELQARVTYTVYVP